MGLFSFSGGAVAGFAKDLAEKVAKRYPPSLDISPEKRVSEARLTRVLEETLAKAVDPFERARRSGGSPTSSSGSSRSSATARSSSTSPRKG
jgi:hypothetical protein